MSATHKETPIETTASMPPSNVADRVAAEPTAGRQWAPFAVVTALFFMWGFLTVLVDALIPRLRAVFELSYFEAGLLQMAFFGAYLLLSLPAGGLIARVGYKRGILVGLATMAAGCLLFIPAASVRVYGLFLLAMFVLAGGITVLQVAANPYVAALGPERTASSRLNLAQAFNSLGTTLAPLVSAAFLLSDEVLTGEAIAALSDAARQSYFAAEAAAVRGPFVALAGALAVLAAGIALFRLPRILETDEAQPGLGGVRTVLQNRHLALGAAAIFVYVGAEVAIGSYLVNYFVSLGVTDLVAGPTMGRLASFLTGGDVAGATPEQVAGAFVAFYWGGAMVGRFVGAGLMRRLDPRVVLATFAASAAALVAVAALADGLVAMWAALAVGLFNSVQFATVFTLAIRGLGAQTAAASGVLCMAIFGGAVIPPAFGAVADAVRHPGRVRPRAPVLRLHRVLRPPREPPSRRAGPPAGGAVSGPAPGPPFGDGPLLGAVETGGTKTVCAVGTGPGDVRVVATVPTTTPEETLGAAAEALAPHGVAALGVGAFGPVDLDPASPTWGRVLRTPKPGWSGADVAGPLGRALGVPVGFDTDVNAAALGEGAAGAACGLDQFAYVTVGTGIGAGVVVGGRPVRGRPHPEVGHVPVPRDASDAFTGVCPFHGDCWEGLASGPAVEARWGRPAEGLPPAHPAWPVQARAVARGLAALVLTASPRRVVLGGGVMDAPGLLGLTRSALADVLAGYVAGLERPGAMDGFVVRPALGGRAGVAGALVLAREALHPATVR